MGATAAVLGASGYAGGELLRLLVGHPVMSVGAAAGATRVGEAVEDVHPQLRGSLELELVGIEEAAAGADICFSCLPHGVLPDHLDAISSGVLVDLADDFRADPGWIYCVPELDRSMLAGASRIANPGCYPTAALLCLVPFARRGLIAGPITVDALSGVSGAGRAARDDLLFATLDGSAAAYGTVAHRHIPEMERGLAAFGSLETTVSFTPHLIPISRGLLVTARAQLTRSITDDEALQVLTESYAGERFVEVVAQWPSTKAVAGTNMAHVSARVDERAGFLICSATIDNLGKGAAGQAIQNANLALGLDEAAGLEAVAAWP
ncbi:MAG TPA: N-acetyl-gamma-glutamyl-phosphate reductase [Actinomycetota bacterium]|nr:N-acetyl-gamma-glutamyl-phosphate reductase [Actinomycetota bacterium]